MLETIIKIRETNFKRKTFSCQWKPFSLIFLPEEAVFPYRGKVFFNDCVVPGSENGFSGQHKPFFIYFFSDSCRRKSFLLSIGNLFLNESFIPAIGEGYFSLMKTVTLLESFFLLVETVTAVSRNQFLKKELILAGKTNFLASGNHFLSQSHIFFKESFITVNGNTFFIPKEQFCLLFSAFFLASENHYLNYREA